MKLGALLQAIKPSRIIGRTDLEVTGIVADSREIQSGSLFVAIAGQRSDGHRFVSEAAARGAKGVVVSHPIETAGPVTVIQVRNSREALALLSATFYGHPSSRLRIVGVTGTNGKTTTSYLIWHILKAGGRRVGMLGTVAYEMEEERLPASLTTPDPPILQRLLARMVDRGIQDVVMEVSSHALELDRVVGCEFDVGVFTNLSQDHLDFHGTMERYFSAKERLFLGLGRDPRRLESKRAVINREDPWGQKLLVRSAVPAWSYGCSPQADIWADGVDASPQGIQFTAHTPAGMIPVRSPLLGIHNISNILAAIGAGLHYGVAIEAIQKGISAVRVVPGRFERVEAGQDFIVIVDYAHTEAALSRLLEAVASLVPGRILTVFGCGGDRDRGKRIPMGQVAARGSDWVIITSDNPRSEEPRSIIREIEVGVQKGLQRGGRAAGYRILTDRRQAIEEAVQMARAGDVVVLAGKGHEDYQLIGSERRSFDDRIVAREAILKSLQLPTPNLFTIPEVLEATQGRLIQGDPHRIVVEGLSTDSRTLKAGELFVALKGERFDGHAFLNEALKRAACGAVISFLQHRIPETPEEGQLRRGKVIIGVNDTLAALQELSRFHRERFRLPVVAITGSNGKTTTKEMAAWILSQDRDVLKSEENVNNQIGVPLTLLRLTSRHRIALVEIGISHAGELRRLAGITRPCVGLITNIGPAHLETLGNMNGVAEAKSELLESMSAEEGMAILNCDDPFFDFLQKKTPCPSVTFGLRPDAQVAATDIKQIGPASTTFRLVIRPEVMGLALDRVESVKGLAEGFKQDKNLVTERQIRLPLAGAHNVMNAVAASAVAVVFGCRLDRIKEALESFRPIAMRSQLLTWRGVSILNDAYNANPASMQAALEVLARFETDGERIAVLGDMLELGETGCRAHQAIGEQMVQISEGRLITVGPLARLMAEAALSCGMSGERVSVCENTDEATAILREKLRRGDAVLVKGSRGMRLERIIEKLFKEP